MNRDRTCVYCGCTESRACAGGCSWIVTHPWTNTGVCSSKLCASLLKADALLADVAVYEKSQEPKRTQSQLP
jgi:hypothetical protein